MGQTEETIARFMRRLAEAAGEAARELESLGAGRETIEQRLDRLNLGTRQRKIVRLPAFADAGGMKASEIAQAIGKDDLPNTYAALESLEKRGVIERVPGESPRRFRLSEPYRS